MNQHTLIILAIAFLVLVTVTNMAIFLSRYVKVAPNQVLIVSGRKFQLPDGRSVGFRIVKGGGTFVIPVIEKAEVLSLEVFSVELRRSREQSAGGRAVEMDCLGLTKINCDDASIVAAAEHFLSKSKTEIQAIVRPVLERHLNRVLGNVNIEEVTQNTAACADRVYAAAAADLARMGLGLVSFTIRNTSAA